MSSDLGRNKSGREHSTRPDQKSDGVVRSTRDADSSKSSGSAKTREKQSSEKISAKSDFSNDGGESQDGVVDPAAPFTRFAERPYKQYSMKNPIANWEERTPTTLFSSTPIVSSPEYNEVVNFQRMKILGVLAVWVVLGPLVFRYALGVHVDGSDRDRPAWGSQLDGWENFILVILYLGEQSAQRMMSFSFSADDVTGYF